jgi:S1-C subfamily serine protease
MEWDRFVVKVIVKSKVIDFNNPLNTFKTESSSGTGFFIKNNLILTCYHVVKYAVNIEVLYQQTNNIEAKIKHIFPNDDLAIIELETDQPIDPIVLDFKVLNSEKLGDVYTIGFPLGSTNIKVTKGIVSGFQGSLIQSDATLNPGNSGGPMVLKEEKDNKYSVIGVNVSKISRIAEGTSYIVPIKRFIITAKVQNKIVIKKPLLFFKFQKLIQEKFRKIIFRNPDLIKYIDMKVGVMVTKLNPSFYLNRYMKPGDVILSINGNMVDYNGTVKLDYYPEKISINDIGLWFVEGDMITMEILDVMNQKIEPHKITLEVIRTNIPDFYGLEIPNDMGIPKYYVEKKGFIFSILTREHIKHIKDLDLYDEENLLQIVRNKSHHRDVFTVYLADLDFSQFKKKFIKYPVGAIIVKINDKMFSSYNEFMELIKEDVISFTTLNGDIYYTNDNGANSMNQGSRKYLIKYK